MDNLNRRIQSSFRLLRQEAESAGSGPNAIFIAVPVLVGVLMLGVTVVAVALVYYHRKTKHDRVSKKLADLEKSPKTEVLTRSFVIDERRLPNQEEIDFAIKSRKEELQHPSCRMMSSTSKEKVVRQSPTDEFQFRNSEDEKSPEEHEKDEEEKKDESKSEPEKRSCKSYGTLKDVSGNEIPKDTSPEDKGDDEKEISSPKSEKSKGSKKSGESEKSVKLRSITPEEKEGKADEEPEKESKKTPKIEIGDQSKEKDSRKSKKSISARSGADSVNSEETELTSTYLKAPNKESSPDEKSPIQKESPEKVVSQSPTDEIKNGEAKSQQQPSYRMMSPTNKENVVSQSPTDEVKNSEEQKESPQKSVDSISSEETEPTSTYLKAPNKESSPDEKSPIQKESPEKVSQSPTDEVKNAEEQKESPQKSAHSPLTFAENVVGQSPTDQDKFKSSEKEESPEEHEKDDEKKDENKSESKQPSINSHGTVDVGSGKEMPKDTSQEDKGDDEKEISTVTPKSEKSPIQKESPTDEIKSGEAKSPQQPTCRMMSPTSKENEVSQSPTDQVKFRSSEKEESPGEHEKDGDEKKDENKSESEQPSINTYGTVDVASGKEMPKDTSQEDKGDDEKEISTVTPKSEKSPIQKESPTDEIKSGEAKKKEETSQKSQFLDSTRSGADSTGSENLYLTSTFKKTPIQKFSPNEKSPIQKQSPIKEIKNDEAKSQQQPSCRMMSSTSKENVVSQSPTDQVKFRNGEEEKSPEEHEKNENEKENESTKEPEKRSHKSDGTLKDVSGNEIPKDTSPEDKGDDEKEILSPKSEKSKGSKKSGESEKSVKLRSITPEEKEGKADEEPEKESKKTPKIEDQSKEKDSRKSKKTISARSGADSISSEKTEPTSTYLKAPNKESSPDEKSPIQKESPENVVSQSSTDQVKFRNGEEEKSPEEHEKNEKEKENESTNEPEKRSHKSDGTLKDVSGNEIPKDTSPEDKGDNEKEISSPKSEKSKGSKKSGESKTSVKLGSTTSEEKEGKANEEPEKESKKTPKIEIGDQSKEKDSRKSKRSISARSGADLISSEKTEPTSTHLKAPNKESSPDEKSPIQKESPENVVSQSPIQKESPESSQSSEEPDTTSIYLKKSKDLSPQDLSPQASPQDSPQEKPKFFDVPQEVSVISKNTDQDDDDNEESNNELPSNETQEKFNSINPENFNSPTSVYLQKPTQESSDSQSEEHD